MENNPKVPPKPATAPDLGNNSSPSVLSKPHLRRTQSRVIFEKFGGVVPLYTLLKALGRPYNKATLYKWTYPRTKGGTGGWVPTHAWPDILAAARMDGVFITSEEMDPRTYVLVNTLGMMKAPPK